MGEKIVLMLSNSSVIVLYVLKLIELCMRIPQRQ
jgi:hypothetical protein